MAKKKHLTIEEAAEAGQTMEAMSWLLLNKPLPSPPVTHGGTMSKTKTHTWNELVHGTDETEAAEPTPALDVAQVDAALARDNARIMEGKAGAAPRTLWQKIACAMGLVGYVQKRGKNQFHKYSYATAADVAEKAREAFLEVGLLFLPTVKAVETREKATSKGGITYITRVTMTYRVMNTTPEESFYDARGELLRVRDGGFYEFEMVGEGQDEGDKSVFKAITGAHKYALMQLLCVSTGDDPEADVKTDETKPVEPTITDEQREGLANEIEMRGRNLDKLLAYFHVETLGDLTVRDYQRALKMLEGAK